MATAKKLSKGSEAPDYSEGYSVSHGYNPYWHSTLFHEVYLLNDVPEQFKRIWGGGEEGDFGLFCNQFRNLCEKYDVSDFDSWSERDTIRNWITPILGMLGYYDKCEKYEHPFTEDESFTFEGKTLKPDYIIVDRPDDLKYIKKKKGDDKLEEAREYVKLPVEAKYWDRLEDYRQNKKEDHKRADKKTKDGYEGIEPADQILNYMKMLHKDWGILTDGKIWRLYHNELSNDSQKRCFQFNLGYLYKLAKDPLKQSQDEYNEFLDNAKYFYHLFCKNALIGKGDNQKIVDTIIEYSKEYVSRIEEDLRVRFVQAITSVCNGYYDTMKNPSSEEKLKLIRNVSESLLFNIMFIKSCESRLVLPMKAADYREKSLTRIVQNLKFFKPEREFDEHNMERLQYQFKNFNGDNNFTFDPDGTEIYERLLDLTEFVQKGSNPRFNNFKIDGFTESVFSEEEWEIASKYKLKNKYIIAAIFEIGYAESDIKGKKYQQIPYNFLTPRQLGSIYESFLGYKIYVADCDMAYIKNQWQSANLNSDKLKTQDVPKVKKNELYFSPGDKERRDTGSYYTPDSVVQFIVKETLAPLVQKRGTKELLKIKVCDPALGSGHFINAALNYMATEYLKALESEVHDDLTITHQDVKRDILNNCIYGVDINPRAVKLAKMGLWLESAKAGASLQKLDSKIKCSNSLTNEDLWRKEWKFLGDGVDAVVGNPPYLGEKGHKDAFQNIAAGWLGKRFYQGKMDLFYFFFHLGLDILKDGGRLGFITTNYYPTALGAKNLRYDFHDRSNIDTLVNLNELKVFGEAAGQHNMITFLTKTNEISKTKVINSNETGSCNREILEGIFHGKSKVTTYVEMEKAHLYDGEEKYIRISNATSSRKGATEALNSVIGKIKRSNFLLGDIFDINQGIVTGADKVGPRHLDKFKNIRANKGDGIFIVNDKELKALQLGKSDRDLLIKPFFKNSDVAKFHTTAIPKDYIIYLDRKRVDIPKSIENHLMKYKEILKCRREVQNGVIKWFQLQWPRENDLFLGPKIVVPQRSRLNTFGYNEDSWYAASDVFFITPNRKSNLDLKYLLAILNSKLYFCWLYSCGKRKGPVLELIAQPLSEIPIMDVDIRTQEKLIKTVEKLIKNPVNITAFNELNSVTYQIFDLNEKEVQAVENFYDEHSMISESLGEDSDAEVA